MFTEYFKYNILKMYSGILRRKHSGNVHNIVVPTSEHEKMFLVIIGEIIKEPNSYACALIIRGATDLVDSVIEAEKKRFGKRFMVLEDLKCIGNDIGQGKYEYKFTTPGYYLKSPLTLTYEPEYSTDKRRIYVLRGEINLETTDIHPKHIQMMAMKKLSLFKK